MNYTKNHHLPQWIESDRIRMKDFNDAMANIEDGLNAAQSSASDLSYVTGSYVGKGAGQTIGVGFRPSFVIISGMSGSGTAEALRYTAMTGGNRLTDRVQFTVAGFMVLGAMGIGADFPDVNAEGVTYDYIAFK